MPTKSNPIARFNQVLLFIVLVFAILYFAKPFLIPVAIGGMMAMLLVPVCKRLERHHVPRALAAVICVLLTLMLLLAVGYLLYVQLIALGKDLPVIGNKLNEMLNSGHDFISEHFQLPVAKQKEYLQSQIAGISDLSGKFIGNVFRSILSFLVHVLIITAYSVLLLIYRRRIKNFVLSLVSYYAGKERVTEAQDIVDKTAAVASAYLAGVFSVALIFSVVNTIGLMIIGIENALFFGVMVAFINIIPYIGSVAGSSVVVLYTLITRDSLLTPTIVAIFFIVMQQIDSYILTPKITGSKIQLNALFTIMALLLGSLVWNVAGMILFVPFLGVAKVIFDHVDSLKPYGNLIGDSDTQMSTDNQ
ncbi:AI-2E family transporter [Parapedobacter defluvii]|uniref:AI-2E family transporter n=1 Tax=Parapedobacter defluvii TaxID=2045106 RepID=A0ABQ1LN72_9SPHI|nr:AI-2E family transporter [Parapedobacter defluvii]RQP18639.1 MAG: AI-2E family transporter [Parapedobacter sp.]GGC25774.1 AI-2E family transporter [Parapedobacter defluvii]